MAAAPVDAGAEAVASVGRPRRRNRSILLWAAAVAVVLFLVAELAARALAPLPPNRVWPDVESQFKAEHAESVQARGDQEGLVFAGSSVSDAAFDPTAVTEAAGYDGGSYNYALQGSLASTTTRFIDAAVLDQVQPDVVVMGVYPGDIGAAPTRAASLGDQLRDSRGYRNASGHPTLADRIEKAASDRSDLVAHREILRDPYRLAKWLRSPDAPEVLDPETGALTRHRDVQFDPDALLTPGASEGTDVLAPIGPEVQAIEDFAAELAERGIRLVVVELPVYEAEWDETANPGALARTHEETLAVGRGRCVERLDLRDLAQEQRYWSDTNHVNGEGTALISEAVGSWLADNPEPPEGC